MREHFVMAVEAEPNAVFYVGHGYRKNVVKKILEDLGLSPWPSNSIKNEATLNTAGYKLLRVEGFPGRERESPQRDHLVLEGIQEFWAANGHSPNITELMKELNIGRSSMRRSIKALAEAGRIIRIPGTHRGIYLPEIAKNVT